ncbi:hypothetical protein HOJ36_07700 [Candidatus Woesearchaeota archaeon]|nr:hypothetical protein [Candidatus Woesearchaeota archaeon]
MKLNMGCGYKVKKGGVNLDFIKGPGIDIIHDLNKFPYPFKADTFNQIYINMVLEELDFYEETIKELYRISKNKATWKIIVPYYNCRTAFNPYHKFFFHLDTFSVFADKNRTHMSRKNPVFYRITRRDLIPNNFIAKIIPKRFRNMFGMIFGEMYKQIIFEMKVIK